MIDVCDNGKVPDMFLWMRAHAGSVYHIEKTKETLRRPFKIRLNPHEGASRKYTLLDLNL